METDKDPEAMSARTERLKDELPSPEQLGVDPPVILAIWAQSESGYIADAQGKLPWGKTMPADKRWYEEATAGEPKLMGTTTYLGPDHNRRGKVIIASRKNRDEFEEQHGGLPDDTDVVDLAGIGDIELPSGKDVLFITGGAEIYQKAVERRLPHILAITEITMGEDEVSAGKKAPDVGNGWKLYKRFAHRDKANKYPYEFKIYLRADLQKQI